MKRIQDEGQTTASEASMDSIQLLASLLMCYPEVGKVVLDPKERGIWLEFSLRDVPEEALLEKVDGLLMDSLRFYHELSGISGARMAFFFGEMALHIFRDIDTLSREEIGMLIALIRDNFSELLLTDTMPPADEDVIYNQSEMIDHRLRFLREYSLQDSMVGIREDGRVMVY